MELENEPYEAIAHLGQHIAGAPRESDSADPYLSCGGEVQRAQNVEEGGLSRPARTDDRHGLSRPNDEIYPAEDFEFTSVPGAIALPHAGGAQNRLPGATRGKPSPLDRVCERSTSPGRKARLTHS